MRIDKIEVYNRSYRLAVDIHDFSLTLPKYLQYDLADQMRRASRSVPSNICEGLMRNKSSKDKINFMRNALGSCDEIQFNLKFVNDVKLISYDRFKYFTCQYEIVGKQLTRFIQRLSDFYPVTSSQKPAASNQKLTTRHQQPVTSNQLS